MPPVHPHPPDHLQIPLRLALRPKVVHGWSHFGGQQHLINFLSFYLKILIVAAMDVDQFLNKRARWCLDLIQQQ